MARQAQAPSHGFDRRRVFALELAVGVASRCRQAPANGWLQIAENIATTVHDVRGTRRLDLAWSRGGTALVGIGAMWAITASLAAGLTATAVGLAMLGFRRLRPRRFLVLDVGDRRLILRVTGGSAPSARALAGRIERALASGELPRTPPALP
jgi:hypothetical protein